MLYNDKIIKFFQESIEEMLSDETCFYTPGNDANQSENFYSGELKSILERRKPLLLDILNKQGMCLNYNNVKIDLEYNRMTGSGETNSKQLFMSQDMQNLIDEYLPDYSNLAGDLFPRTNKITPDILIHQRKKNTSFSNLFCIEAKVCTNPSFNDYRKDILRLMLFADGARDGIIDYAGSKFGYIYQIFIRYCSYGNEKCMKVYFFNFPNLSMLYRDKDHFNEKLEIIVKNVNKTMKDLSNTCNKGIL